MLVEMPERIQSNHVESEAVRQPAHPTVASIEHMSIDHYGLYVLMMKIRGLTPVFPSHCLIPA